MAKRKKPSGDRTAPTTPGNVARSARETLRSYTVGALPILDDLMRRMRLAEFLRAALPPEDRRTKLSPVKALLVLLRNLLLSREPIYGVGEWATRRSGRIEKALKQLAALREKLRSPRTRYRQEAKVATAVAEVLASCGADAWIVTEVQPQTQETFHQDHRGRPGKDTHYVKKTATRFDLAYRIDDARVAAEASGDGIFPLVTNVADLSELELLHAYKRQPAIEKRFSQFKTDFEVAPVYLKAVHRIQALLCVYFFALLVEALLERQLRRAMQRHEIEALPMYPEGRPCRWPTARRVMDLFESVQRHTLAHRQRPTEVLLTDLTRLQRKLLRLLGLPARDYGT